MSWEKRPGTQNLYYFHVARLPDGAPLAMIAQQAGEGRAIVNAARRVEQLARSPLTPLGDPRRHVPVAVRRGNVEAAAATPPALGTREGFEIPGPEFPARVEAEVVGDEPCVMIEFDNQAADTYAKD